MQKSLHSKGEHNVRSTQFYEDPEVNRRFLQAIDSYQASAKVAQDETTEQVFSRKDRKVYREALKQRTETTARNAKRKASTLGQESKVRRKAARS
jgi:hypothetical protein